MNCLLVLAAEVPALKKAIEDANKEIAKIQRIKENQVKLVGYFSVPRLLGGTCE